MGEGLYRFLKYVALALGGLCIAYLLYDSFGYLADHDARTYQAGERLFQDGKYDLAAERFDELAVRQPDNAAVLRGLARSLMQTGQDEAAFAAFDRAIALDPTVASVYANRGILHDRRGEYEAAVADYRRAVETDAELVEGPGWLTRFLRNQPEAPPTVADRLAYLQAELAKPPGERALSDPAADAAQRSFRR
ncbi:MAG: hypothetical protein CMM50_06720 [Rhodospirillaceae bacterium]|nr:hypothetical protein [Rhodospirillaceae bacterium]|tara:strand:- start:861 stop:1439 length:579 start_codon:yes stop_codon:yes gene_type:complete